LSQHPAQSSDPATATAGLLYGLAAFSLWGLFPLYFKAVAAVPAPEVLAHRIVWSVVCVGLLLVVVRQWPAVIALVRDRAKRRYLALSALLIAGNWLLFIWAVAHEHVLQASLGYFVTPLLSVLLGRLVLGERLRAHQWLAVALAGAGVTWLVVGLGVVPWVALGLAASFGSYGLVRKIANVRAIPALFVEITVLAPPALAWLVWLGAEGAGHLGAHGLGLDLLLAAAGVVTATPLILFGQATQRLRLAAVGLLQYIVPTMQMLLAVVVFAEPFTHHHGVAFVCIWMGLAL
jgi:chloramphenicol-sensitive protein RarD